MHEHHQVEKLVKDLITATGGRKVKSLCLVMGDLPGFDETSVRLYFENFTEGTPAEGAELKVRWIRGELRCPACGRNFVKIKSRLDCPTCGRQGTPTAVGREFHFDEVVTD
ncbi:MAG: hydrogenase maturation nickel metallochaperone HypA [Deltaproteobacteria bacterium]|nr:hydrogenase maturation nickel metallochaperone HypA [Deltaproteobacteria bacterium]